MFYLFIYIYRYIYIYKYICIYIYMRMSAGYYKKNEEILQKKACRRYQDLSEEDKNKKHRYACKQYRNLFEEEKYG